MPQTLIYLAYYKLMDIVAPIIIILISCLSIDRKMIISNDILNWRQGITRRKFSQKDIDIILSNSIEDAALILNRTKKVIKQKKRALLLT